MGAKSIRQARNPQPDGKKEQRRKSLKEFAGEMKADMLEKARQESMRRSEESRRADEDAVLMMAFGPSSMDAAE